MYLSTPYRAIAVGVDVIRPLRLEEIVMITPQNDPESTIISKHKLEAAERGEGRGVSATNLSCIERMNQKASQRYEDGNRYVLKRDHNIPKAIC